MIVFTRLNRKPVALNPDLIERVEATPDTVVTLVDGKKFLVLESLDEVVGLVADFRAYVIARSTTIERVETPRPALHLVPTAVVVTRDTGNEERRAEIEQYVSDLSAGPESETTAGRLDGAY